MKKRDITLGRARSAGYHNDSAEFTRLLIENRIARSAMIAAWSLGARAKQRGAHCACPDCDVASATGKGGCLR